MLSLPQVRQEQAKLWEEMKAAVRRYRLGEAGWEEVEATFAKAEKIVPERVRHDA